MKDYIYLYNDKLRVRTFLRCTKHSRGRLQVLDIFIDEAGVFEFGEIFVPNPNMLYDKYSLVHRIFKE